MFNALTFPYHRIMKISNYALCLRAAASSPSSSPRPLLPVPLYTLCCVRVFVRRDAILMRRGTLQMQRSAGTACHVCIVCVIMMSLAAKQHTREHACELTQACAYSTHSTHTLGLAAGWKNINVQRSSSAEQRNVSELSGLIILLRR